MTIPFDDNPEVPDEQIDKIYQQLVGQAPSFEADESVAGARAVLDLINKVRAAELKETPANAETLDEHFDASTTAVDQALPNQIGRFEIKRVIGRGGFGLVLLANDPNLGRDVALKIPRPETISTDELRSRFLREGRAAALLSHPNIVPVFESGQEGAVLYLASHFVDGPTLEKWQSDEKGPVDPRLAAEIVAQLSEAVGHAHQRGVFASRYQTRQRADQH